MVTSFRAPVVTMECLCRSTASRVRRTRDGGLPSSVIAATGLAVAIGDLSVAAGVTGRTIEYHRAQIRAHLGFRECSVAELPGVLEFRSNHATHRPVLDALDLIRRHADARLTYYPAGESVPTHKRLLGDWTTLVYKDAGKAGWRVVRSVYEICTFQALRERLRCKEIWVVGADRWRNPDEDLPADFEAHRDAHYAALRKPLDPTAFIDQLREELRESLRALDAGLPRLTWLEIAEHWQTTGASTT